MADEATTSRKRASARQRMLLWSAIFLVIIPIAGWIDARAAVYRYFHNRMVNPGQILFLLVHRTDDGFDLRAERTPADYENAWAMLSWIRHRERAVSGLVFPSWRVFGKRELTVRPLRSDLGEAQELTEEELAPFRPLLADYIRRDPYATYRWCDRLAEMGMPNADFRGPIWLGLLGNGLFYSLVLTGTIFGLTRLRMLGPEATRRRRLRRGVCPRCRYQIRGLPEQRCPECGETWTEVEVE